MFGCSGLRVTFAVCFATFSHVCVAEQKPSKTWQINQTIATEPRPLLCRDLASAELVVSVVGLGIKARDKGAADKAKRLYQLAAGLQSEICLKPEPDDILIVRCKVKDHDFVSGKISVAKLSAVIRSQASRGEQAFYAWTYNLVLDSAESDKLTKTAHARWCADDAQQQVAKKPEKLDLTPRMILSVQYRLYDLGYPITVANGQQTGELVKVLSAFQHSTGLQATGRIDKVTLDRLAGVRPPGQWISIAFDGAGKYGLITDGASRRGAEERAIAALKRRTSADYRLMAQPAPGCFALAMTRFRGRKNGRRMNFTNTFASFGKTKDDARKAVMAYCNRAKSGGKCRVKKTGCAQGDVVARPGEHRPAPGRVVPASTDDKPERYERDNLVQTPAPTPKRFDPGAVSQTQGPKSERFDPKNLIQSQDTSPTRYEPSALAGSSEKPPPDRIDPGSLLHGAGSPKKVGR